MLTIAGQAIDRTLPMYTCIPALLPRFFGLSMVHSPCHQSTTPHKKPL